MFRHGPKCSSQDEQQDSGCSFVHATQYNMVKLCPSRPIHSSLTKSKQEYRVLAICMFGVALRDYASDPWSVTAISPHFVENLLKHQTFSYGGWLGAWRSVPL